MIVFQHGRSDWVPPGPSVSGPAFNWDTIEWVVLHYTAANDLVDGDLGEFEYQIPPYLRAIHRDYLNRKPNGYSIGYNAAVDWLGGTWELRGDTYKAAANANPAKPGDENAKTFAILMLVDGQDGATPLAAAAVRGLVAQIRAVRPNVIVLGHRDVDATQCPGTGVYAQIVGGVFEPGVVIEPPPPPPPPPPPEAKCSGVAAAAPTTSSPKRSSTRRRGNPSSRPTPAHKSVPSCPAPAEPNSRRCHRPETPADDSRKVDHVWKRSTVRTYEQALTAMAGAHRRGTPNHRLRVRADLRRLLGCPRHPPIRNRCRSRRHPPVHAGIRVIRRQGV